MQPLDAIKAAHVALLAPTEAATYGDVAIVTLSAFALCGLFHILVARLFKRTYFALHVFANIVITALVLPGALRALVNADSSTVVTGAVQPNSVYMCWIYALHIYHPIFFKTGTMDWVHHVPVYVVTTLMFSVPSCDAVHLQSLVLTGIPGGLDYFLQVLEGQGLLGRAAYKEHCCVINTWLRAPLGAVSAYVCLLGLYHGWAHCTTWEAFVYFVLGIHAVWNPPFFCRQAVEANVVDCVNRFGLSTAELKLPKVRALSGREAKRTDAAAKEQ